MRDPDDCPLCLGRGEIQAVNLGEDGHSETVPCPECMSREHRAEMEELRLSFAA